MPPMTPESLQATWERYFAGQWVGNDLLPDAQIEPWKVSPRSRCGLMLSLIAAHDHGLTDEQLTRIATNRLLAGHVEDLVNTLASDALASRDGGRIAATGNGRLMVEFFQHCDRLVQSRQQAWSPVGA